MKIRRKRVGTATKLFSIVIASGMTLTLAAPASSAQFAGDTVNATYIYPTSGSVYQNLGSQVVSPIATFTFANGIAATVNSSSILLDLSPNNFGAASFNGAVFTDLTQSNIIGASLDASSNLAGFDASRLTFSSNSVSFNFQGLSEFPQSLVRANVQFGGAVGAVPEPATWAMILVGFGGIGIAARSRRFRKSVTA